MGNLDKTERASGRSTATIYSLLTTILLSGFTEKVLYVGDVAHLIEEVWERSFKHTAPLEDFLACIDTERQIPEFHGINVNVFVDHFLSECKIENIKLKIKHLKDEMKQHEASLVNHGLFKKAVSEVENEDE